MSFDRLDEIQARADQATEGPWSRFETVMADTFVVGPRGFIREDIVSGPTYERENAEFIAHARTDVPALVAAVRKVASLHRPVSVEGFDVCERCSSLAGSDAVVSWPCLTYRALDSALGVTS